MTRISLNLYNGPLRFGIADRPEPGTRPTDYLHRSCNLLLGTGAVYRSDQSHGRTVMSSRPRRKRVQVACEPCRCVSMHLPPPRPQAHASTLELQTQKNKMPRRAARVLILRTPEANMHVCIGPATVLRGRAAGGRVAALGGCSG